MGADAFYSYTAGFTALLAARILLAAVLAIVFAARLPRRTALAVLSYANHYSILACAPAALAVAAALDPRYLSPPTGFPTPLDTFTILSATALVLVPAGAGGSTGSASIPGWLKAAVAVAAAPVYEEVLFRMLLLGLLEAVIGAPAAAIASAAVFALYHLGTAGITRLPQIFAAGLVLAIPPITEDTIIPSIVAHTAANTVSLAARVIPSRRGTA